MNNLSHIPILDDDDAFDAGFDSVLSHLEQVADIQHIFAAITEADPQMHHMWWRHNQVTRHAIEALHNARLMGKSDLNRVRGILAAPLAAPECGKREQVPDMKGPAAEPAEPVDPRLLVPNEHLVNKEGYATHANDYAAVAWMRTTAECAKCPPGTSPVCLYLKMLRESREWVTIRVRKALCAKEKDDWIVILNNIEREILEMEDKEEKEKKPASKRA